MHGCMDGRRAGGREMIMTMEELMDGGGDRDRICDTDDLRIRCPHC